MSVDLGVLFRTDRMTGAEFRDYGRRLEQTGVESAWVAELFGREPFTAAGALLAATDGLKVGTAIANIYARDATAAAAGAATLADLSGDRFILGLGVSNRGLVGARGHDWQPPVAKLSDYLQQVRDAPIEVRHAPYPVYVAAHGPKMLATAAESVDGVFTYLMTPGHTAATRATLDATGRSVAITPMMMCLGVEDPDEARRIGRSALAYYVSLDYYHRAWRLLGFEDQDFENGGSDRLIDAILPWGSPSAIADRLAEHGDAGADRLLLIPLNPSGGSQPDWALLDALADR